MSIKENHNSNEIDKNSDEVSIISKNDIQINTKNFRHSKTIQPHKYMVVRIVLVTLIFYVLSSILDIYEHLNEFVEKHENINLDEFIIAGVFLAFWMIIEILMLLKVVKKQSLNHEKSSFIDSLTQVNNRRGFFKDAEEKFKKNSKIHNGDRKSVV